MQQDWEKRLQDEQERIRVLASETPLNSFLHEIPLILKNWENAPGEWYGLIALRICDLLNSVPYSGQKEAQNATWKLAEETIQKKEDTLSIPTTVHLLYHLSSEPLCERKDWNNCRFQRVQLWVKTWTRFETEKDNSFNPENVPELNVSPPKEAKLPRGIAPEFIFDPELRQEYLQAIEQNQLKAENYNYQFRLRKLEIPFKKIASNYLINLYSKEPRNIEEIQKLLKANMIAIEGFERGKAL